MDVWISNLLWKWVLESIALNFPKPQSCLLSKGAVLLQSRVSFLAGLPSEACGQRLLVMLVQNAVCPRGEFTCVYSSCSVGWDRGQYQDADVRHGMCSGLL